MEEDNEQSEFTNYLIEQDKKRAIMLFAKGVDALKDRVFPIASSFFDMAIELNPEFAEAYLMRAIVERTNLPQVLSTASDLETLLPFINKAHELNPKLEFAIKEVIKGNLNYKNVEEWMNDNGKVNASVSSITPDEVNGWERASVTNDKDSRVWRKDKFEALMKLSELNKQTEFGWKIRINPYHNEIDAWHWQNLTDISGGNITQKVTSSGNGNVEKSRGCYVATLCYGNSECDEVLILKKYRDEVLVNTEFGRFLIKTYYLFSPKIVSLLNNKQKINNLIKNIVLEPMVRRIKKKFKEA